MHVHHISHPPKIEEGYIALPVPKVLLTNNNVLLQCTPSCVCLLLGAN